MNDSLIKRDDLDRQLTNVLRRVQLERPLPLPKDDEPSDEELLLLVEDKLSPSERTALEARLLDHPYSADRVAILREALAEMASAVTAEAGLVRLVFLLRRGAKQALDFLRGTDQPVWLPAMAMATRGAGETSADVYKFERRFGTCEAVIEVERVPNRGMELHVALREGGQPVNDVRASLKRQGKLVESIRVRDGVVAFVDLEPACYEVELRRQDTAIGSLAVDFLAL